jgi:FtsH-binding integral membrane protein
VTEISDTRRRAELRGRESVAQWRIRTGLWAGRVLAAFTVVPVLLAFTRRGAPPTAIVLWVFLFGGLVLLGAELSGRGRRWAAWALLVLFLLSTVMNVLAGRVALFDGIVGRLIMTFCLAQGVWGTMALARVRREAALVPPAPPREAVEGAPRRPVIRAGS